MSGLIQQFIAFARRFPVVVGSLAAFVLLGVANYFLWERQHALQVQHEEARKKGEAMLQSLATHPRVLAELAAVKEALLQIDHNLIEESDLAVNLGYFYQIETLSRVHYTQLSQLNSQATPENNPYRAIPFALRITGTYNQLINLLHELETGPRLLRVKTCTLARGDIKTNALNMDLTVELLGSR